VAIWGNNRDVFSSLNEPLHLIISSPPYPLRSARAYGNHIGDYNDFICSSIEPLLRNLVPGGSIVLNVGDVFEEKSPAKSMYVERLILALHDRLSLSLMNRVIWHNPTKPPGPTYWACVNRVQLCGSYEHLLWMTNDPHRVRSDNRRVLEEHTEAHKKLMARGGEQRQASYGDGAYRIRPDSFGAVTAGRIPKDILTRSHNCPDTRAYRKFASELGLPAHGAMQPTSIPDFFIRLLTQPDELVADLFSGTGRAGLAAERLGRRWIMSEQIVQFLRPAAEMFRSFPGFSIHPSIEQFVAPQSN
jgi:site-specific DNA-methyltransferase (cytosine-N4-specific)